MLPKSILEKLVIPIYNRIYELNRERYWLTKESGLKMKNAYEAQPENTKAMAFFVEQVMKLRPFPKSVLEVGCGYGRLLKVLKTSGKFERLTGVDISSKQLEVAEKYIGDGVELSWCDICDSVPYRDNSFDLVYTSGVLMHIPPKLYPDAVNNCIRLSRKWLIHVEDLTKGYPKYGHDVYRTYRELGYKAKLIHGYPEEENQNIQFVVVKI